MKNWPKKHSTHINHFKDIVAKLDYEKTKGPLLTPQLHNEAAFNEYLVWLQGSARLKLNPPAFSREDVLAATNLPFDQLANLNYNKLIRDGTGKQDLAPVLNFVVSYVFSYVLVELYICINVVQMFFRSKLSWSPR